MESRIPASEWTSQKLSELLTQGVAEGDARSELIKLAVRKIVEEAVLRQNLIRLGQERRDPSIRPQAKTPSLVGGRATGIVRPSALHGHTTPASSPPDERRLRS